jgi:hypothetical protein
MKDLADFATYKMQPPEYFVAKRAITLRSRFGEARQWVRGSK